MRLLRVLSANLARGREHAASFAGMARALEADVVAVQELAEEQAQALAAVFPFGVLQVRPHRMGIALRNPGSVRRVTLAGRDAYVAEVNVLPSGGVIEVVNAHIVAPHVGLPWKIAALRRRQVDDLETYLRRSGETPLILIGDLNSTPLSPAYRRLSKFLTDAAIEVARLKGRRPRRTWGLWYGPRLLRIDHVLVRGVSIVNVEVHRLARSDHSAVVIDVRIGASSRSRSLMT